jgi:hypothetical protein
LDEAVGAPKKIRKPPRRSAEPMTRGPTIEETPEQVLARLERYASSLRAPALPPTTAAPVPVFTPRSEPTVRTWEIDGAAHPAVTAPRTTLQDLRHVGFEAAGYLLFFVCSFATIVLFQQVNRTIASVLVLGFVIGGIVAIVRRVPLALWWTLGFAIGGLIARFS